MCRGVELLKANEADFIGVSSLQVTAEAGTGKQLRTVLLVSKPLTASRSRAR